MPYMLVRSSLNPAFSGPTFIDYHTEGEFSFPEAMTHLGARCIRGCDEHIRYHHDPCCSYQTSEPPYKVLDSLEKQGYKVVAANSAADTTCSYQPLYGGCYPVQPVWQIWTLHKQAQSNTSQDKNH